MDKNTILTMSVNSLTKDGFDEFSSALDRLTPEKFKQFSDKFLTIKLKSTLTAFLLTFFLRFIGLEFIGRFYIKDYKFGSVVLILNIIGMILNFYTYPLNNYKDYYSNPFIVAISIISLIIWIYNLVTIAKKTKERNLEILLDELN